ncbi:MAG: bifunctional phosphoribosyl-AMP cyclohydrolase/phosphoribosyl-ATP diphosphatase HisIE [Schwartzia sp.]|nr:bifunctional phosphoribosyl-AMP cyclohydrolase/phosphoribosyl-ATP diphosphatase HisIE [Schwartzia sp. (in: firmicutes)]
MEIEIADGNEKKDEETKKIDISMVNFDEKGLVPAIIQEENGQVLMLAYMNKESLEKTLETGYTWFYSRSRKKLWNKGEESGNTQKVKEICYDCDGDTLLVRVHQKGVACHTGTYSCFSGRRIGDSGKSIAVIDEMPKATLVSVLDDLYNVIQDRQIHPVDGSYTNYLFKNGQDKILKKVGEEAAETIIASKNMSREEVIYEMGDLWYHCLVLLAFHNLPPDAIFAELMNRRNGGEYHKFTGKTGKRPEM